jgi:hypothetical protein
VQQLGRGRELAGRPSAFCAKESKIIPAVPAAVPDDGRKGGAKRWACWKCGARMRKKALMCKQSRKTDPAAVKAQIASLTKSYGQVRPVAVPVVKAARPRCPNPACRGQAVRPDDNCCTRCGTAFGAVHMARADKSARLMQQSRPHSPEWWDARAAAQWNPADREQCRAGAQKARQARGQENLHLAQNIVKASGSRSLAEAYRRETDPRTREILRGVLNEGRTA